MVIEPFCPDQQKSFQLLTKKPLSKTGAFFQTDAAKP
jgi:hypothetical protein